jgi:predicted O-methyltransferase YrrM
MIELLLLIALAGLAAGLYALKKVHAIHVATYEMRERLSDIQREVLAIFPQTQALAALERLLGLPQALPPTRGWVGSPDFLLAVARQALQQRPARVIECSSGVSTLVLARCMQMNGQGHVYSLEHEAVFADKTRAMLREYGLSDFATVVHAPLVRDGDRPWYDAGALPAAAKPADLLVIDGPPASLGPLARYPALPRLAPALAEHCVLMLDDAGRPDGQEIVARWLREYPAFRSEYLPSEKGLAVLTR